MSLRVTGLYVPGDRPDRFEKALASGADAVVLDLEDAVAPERKRSAREAVVAALPSLASTGVALQVRVNPGDADDLAALVGVAGTLGIEVRVPKATVASLDAVAAALPGVPLTALLEDAAGVLDARTIAAHPAVAALALGEADLGSAIGPGTEVRGFARMQAVFAAAAAGLVPPMLSVFAAIPDLAGLLADTREGAAAGFVGRMAVHPSQLPVIRDAFRPAAAEVERAREVVLRAGAGGVARLADGAMVDPAMLRAAERVLALAEHLG